MMFLSVLLILGIGFFFPHHPVDSGHLPLETFARLPEIIALLEWATSLLLAGIIAFHLNGAGARAAAHDHQDQPWIPLISTGLFAAIVAAARAGAWVPVEIASILALPCVLIPPLFYRVTHIHQPKEIQPLFRMEEVCRSLDAAAASSLIREFLERYPHANVYLYRSTQPHSAGGFFFHNREILALPQPTQLEVTLNCPFTTRPGVLAEGRETFRAYLHRPSPGDSRIHVLPQQDWEAWLMGMTQKEWMERIQDLDQVQPHHQNINGLPYQFYDNPWKWQSISLK